MPLILITPYTLPAPTGSSLTSTTLLHFDGANGSSVFTDEKSNLVFSPAYTPYSSYVTKLSSADFKFGSSSVNFYSSGYLTAPPKDIFGQGDFTMDFWFKPSVDSSSTGDLSYLFTAGASLQIKIQARNAKQLRNIHVYATSSQGVIINSVVTTDVISAGTSIWYHFMITRTGTEYSFYLDGNKTYSVSGAPLAAITGNITMGWRPGDALINQNGITPFTGYIDEFRIVKGSSETSSVTYPVPTGPYTK